MVTMQWRSSSTIQLGISVLSNTWSVVRYRKSLWVPFMPGFLDTWLYPCIQKFEANFPQIDQNRQTWPTTWLQLGTGKPWPPGSLLRTRFSPLPKTSCKSLEASFAITTPSESPKMTSSLLFRILVSLWEVCGAQIYIIMVQKNFPPT